MTLRTSTSTRQAGAVPAVLLGALALGDERLHRRQLRLIFSHSTYVTVGVVLVSLCAALVVRPAVDGRTLALWFLASLLPVALRALCIAAWRRRAPAEQDARHLRWATLYCTTSVLNGIAWGVFTALFHTADPRYFGLVFAMHLCYIGFASVTSSVYLPAFVAFMLPASLIFLGVLVVDGGVDYAIHAALLVVSGVAVLVYARRNALSVAEQLRLRLENERLLADLTVQRDRAEEAMLAKNRFLAAASHDLRQPVHALGLFAGSLESQLRDPEPRGVLALIREAIAALGGLFESLLDISKLDAGVVDNAPRDVALAPLVERLHAEHAALAEAKGLALEIDVDPALSARADPTLLERVLLNLIGNAIRYTDAGGVSVRARDSADGRVAIAVVDSGRGIPFAEHERIFSEYHQLDNPARDRVEGLGLGLAIVRRLCALIGAEIALESAPGAGSTFTVTLERGGPARTDAGRNTTEDVPHRSDDPAGASTTAGVATEDDLAWCRVVLVVDDEPHVRDGMRRILGSWNIASATGASAREAIDALLARDDEAVPDALVVDLRLAGGASGLDAIAAIREEFNADVPALVITGDTGPEQLRLTRGAGVPVLHKPLTPARLRRELARLGAGAPAAGERLAAIARVPEPTDAP